VANTLSFLVIIVTFQSSTHHASILTTYLKVNSYTIVDNFKRLYLIVTITAVKSFMVQSLGFDAGMVALDLMDCSTSKCVKNTFR
jgi:hypothetical protein